MDNPKEVDWEKEAREGKGAWVRQRLKEVGVLQTKTLKQIEDEKEEQKNPANLFSRENQVREFMKLKPYFYDRAGSFWLWDNDAFRWMRVDDVDILNMINSATGQDVITSKSRTEIINAMKQEGRKNIPEDIKPTWVQFKNKIYDYTTGECFEASPKYFVTNPIPFEVSHNSDTPTMDKIFEEWVGKDYVKTLYQIIAYCLIPDYPISRIFCFVGSGMNGKSKYLELLRKFIGDENCCSTELDSLLASRFEVTRLYKKLVCQMGETNFNELGRTSMLKKLSGGDLIGFEYKGKEHFEGINYAKLIISTNNLPATTDKTVGFYRRWMLIDFPNQFSEQKDILGDIPQEEYNNLATRCLCLLNELLADRMFHKEGSIEERIERYEARSNFLEKFIEDYVKESSEGFITSADFSKKFNAWCKENRHREIAENTLAKKMKALGYEKGRKYFDWLYDGKGGQLMCWFGISWKD